MSKELSSAGTDFSLQRMAIEAAIEVSKKRALDFSEALDALFAANSILQGLSTVVGYSRDDKEQIKLIIGVLRKHKRLYD